MSVYLLTHADNMQGFIQRSDIQHKDIIHLSQVDKIFRKCIKEQMNIFLHTHIVPSALEFLGFKVIFNKALETQTAHLSTYIWMGGKLPDLVHTLQQFNTSLPFYNKLLSVLPKISKPTLRCFIE